MKIAILGANGQLGRELVGLLRGECLGWTRRELDLARPQRLGSLLDAARPDTVINCAAYNLVDQAEEEPEAALAVNLLGVRELALACDQRRIRLVHFSTDYVFGLDDARRWPYGEQDLPGPVNLYGASKLMGEYAVRSLCVQHLVIRTCGLYGHHGVGGKGGNFVETMLRKARAGERLRVVSDQTCCPTATLDLARAALALVKMELRGLFHLTNAGSCTWFEFAREIMRQAGLETGLAGVTSREYGARARRPGYSVLDIRAAQTLLTLRPWQEALAEYLATKG